MFRCTAVCVCVCAAAVNPAPCRVPTINLILDLSAIQCIKPQPFPSPVQYSRATHTCTHCYYHCHTLHPRPLPPNTLLKISKEEQMSVELLAIRKLLCFAYCAFRCIATDSTGKAKAPPHSLLLSVDVTQNLIHI